MPKVKLRLYKTTDYRSISLQEDNNFITVHPNPVVSELTVSYELPEDETVQVIIDDLYGTYHQEIASLKQYKKGAYQHKINLNKLKPGYYVVTLKTNGKTYTETILKQ